MLNASQNSGIASAPEAGRFGEVSVSIRDLQVHYGSLAVLRDLNLEVAQGEFLVLLGASGCGKSTLLNCIAGLLETSNGQIWIKGRDVTWAEPSERGIGMVFQSYALYPQMTVEGNLSFGLKNARVAKDEIKRRIAQAAQILHLQPLLKRKPSALSGGQRQRVAIGRALVRDVDVFLFDEPLSNLDAQLRAELRVELKRLHQKLKNTMIYVTHDQIEAMTLADRIAVMRHGVIQQLASPAEIYNAPANLYVAGFIGAPPMNLLSGQIENGRFTGCFAAEMRDYPFRAGFSGPAVFGIRPEHVVVGEAARHKAIRQEVTVDLVETMGAETLLWAKLGGEDFRVRVDGQTKIQAGQQVTLGIDTGLVSLFDKNSENRL